MSQYYAPQPYPVYQNAPVNANTVQNRNNYIIWVVGEEGANSYVLAPNTSVILLDAQKEGRMYIKSADNIGMCTLRTFDYKEIIDVNPVDSNASVQYATKQDIMELRQMIDALKGEWHEQSVQSAKYSSVPATY